MLIHLNWCIHDDLDCTKLRRCNVIVASFSNEDICKWRRKRSWLCKRSCKVAHKVKSEIAKVGFTELSDCAHDLPLNFVSSSETYVNKSPWGKNRGWWIVRILVRFVQNWKEISPVGDGNAGYTSTRKNFVCLRKISTFALHSFMILLYTKRGLANHWLFWKNGITLLLRSLCCRNLWKLV